MEDEVTVVIQVNGKTRGTMVVSSDLIDNKETIEKKATEIIQKHLEGKSVARAIHVPGKVVNFVV